MSEPTQEQIKAAVRERYAGIAIRKEESCCGGGGSCGGGAKADNCCSDSTELGYSIEELKNAPEGADLGLGCGNPQALANLNAGEVVLDLGSGAGIDCFLAAKRVGAEGRVIGVDMTHEMLAKARENAAKGKFSNVEFRLGEIEHIPAADDSVDVVISNCVINLSPDKAQVFREAFRVLKRGGRLAVADVVATAKLPDEVRRDLSLYSGCMSGAVFMKDLEGLMASAGFADIRIEPKDASRKFIREWAPGRRLDEFVVSANITARKP